MPPLWNESSQILTPLQQVLDLLAVLTGMEIRHVFELFIRNRHAKTVTELADGIDIHFLLLVGYVLGLTGLSHSIAFDGFGQDNRWLLW